MDEVLLDKYKKISPPDDVVRTFVTKILNERGIEVRKRDVRVVAGVVIVKAHPVYKSEMLKLKPELLALLVGEFGQKSPKDIR